MRLLTLLLLFFVAFSAELFIVYEIKNPPFEGCIRKIYNESVSVFESFPSSVDFSPVAKYFVDNNLICFSTNKERIYVYYGKAREQTFSCNYTNFSGKILCYKRVIPNITIVEHGEGNYTVEYVGQTIILRGECNSCTKLFARYKSNYSENALAYFEGEGYKYFKNGGFYYEKSCKTAPCSFEIKILNYSLVKGYESEIEEKGMIYGGSDYTKAILLNIGGMLETTTKSNDVSVEVKMKELEFHAESNKIELNVEWGTWIVYDNVTLDAEKTVSEPLMVKHEIYTYEGEGIIEEIEETFPKDIYIVSSEYPFNESIEGDYRVVRFYLNESINPEKKVVFTYYITTNKSGDYDILLGKIIYKRDFKIFTLAPHWYHVYFYNVEGNEMGLVYLDKGVPESVAKGEEHEIKVFVDISELGKPDYIVLENPIQTKIFYLNDLGGGEYSANVRFENWGPYRIKIKIGNDCLLLQRVNVNKVFNLLRKKITKMTYRYEIPSEDLSEMEEIKSKEGTYKYEIYFEVPNDLARDYKIYGALIKFSDGTTEATRNVLKINGKLYVKIEDDPRSPYTVTFLTAAKGAPTLIPE